MTVNFVPEEKGVESIGRQIKLTGRAYPVFDIARLILRKPERYHLVFAVIKKPDGQPAQQLWVCSLDDTLWLSEQEAVDHALRRHFETFYQAEKVATEPPKGTYTFVAQCGLSGEILGPPNLNEVQIRMRKLHAERFARMPFDAYKSKVRIIKDEEVVKKWIEQQSWKTEYNCLNIPEPRKLSSRDEVEKHFREVHQANICRAVESHTLGGRAAQQLPSQPLRFLLRKLWDEQSRFPIRLVMNLSHQFAGLGLQFFKVNKTVTHVCVARPSFLDVQVTPVSNGILRIVEFINSAPQCTRKKLLDALAPIAPHAASSTSGGSELAVGGLASPEAGATAASSPSAASSGSQVPTAEQTAVIADLHWLIHQGHVIEFANGKLETAKKPIPKPVKQSPKAPEAPQESDKSTLTAVARDATPDGGGESESTESARETVGQPAVEKLPEPAAEHSTDRSQHSAESEAVPASAQPG